MLVIEKGESVADCGVSVTLQGSVCLWGCSAEKCMQAAQLYLFDSSGFLKREQCSFYKEQQKVIFQYGKSADEIISLL